MKREPVSNIVFGCVKHSSKPVKGWAEKPLSFFRGRWVKKGFAGINPLTGEGSIEHMWVKVTSIRGAVLCGVLDNHPLFDMDLVYGSKVRVNLSEIEQVFDGKLGRYLDP